MDKGLCLVICRNYLREALAVVQSEAFKGVAVSSYPDACHHPQAAGRATLDLVNASPCGEGFQVMIVGGCFLGGAKELFDEVDSENLYDLDQCFYLLCSKPLIESYMGQGAYLLTPGWLEGWREHISQWGFDQATARSFFQECARKLVLLDTGVDPNSASLLHEFASFVDLPTQVVPVGLEHFRLALEKLVLEWRLRETEATAAEALNQANRKLANYSIAFDLLSELARIMDEQQAFQEIVHLFMALFAAARVVYIPVTRAGLGPAYDSRGGSPGAQELQSALAMLEGGDTYVETERGFWLKIHYQDEVLAVLGVEEITFSQYRRQYLNLAIEVARLCGLVISNARSISARLEAERSIRAALEERESLLHEIHHRVKNNLMIVISLLDWQSNLIEDGRAQQAFQETKDRLYTMALVYEELYAAGNLSQIRLDEYLYKLTDNLYANYMPGPDVRLDFQAAAITLDLEKAIPCGLIVNELVSNALRHAFPAGRAGRVQVILQNEGEQLALTVADDGVGLSEALDFREARSLGLHLVRILVQQLEGIVELTREGGTTYRITFIG